MAKLEWISDSNGSVPKGAVCGGYNAIDEEPLFIGKTQHAGSTIIGKISASHRCIYVPYGGKEYSYKQYEVLVNAGNRVHLEWENDSDGNSPPGAVEGGYDANLRAIDYIGKCSIMGSTTPGKVVKAYKLFYIPYDGKEFEMKQYSVLVQK